jgi:hypothetical protein
MKVQGPGFSKLLDIRGESGHRNGADRRLALDSRAPSDQIRVILCPALHQTSLPTNLELLTVALRNLFENILQHMPHGGTARWSVQKGAVACS